LYDSRGGRRGNIIDGSHLAAIGDAFGLVRVLLGCGKKLAIWVVREGEKNGAGPMGW
jgi:hypothetical protein